jgi:predicted Zn-dependent protease
MALELAQTKPELALHIADAHGYKWSIAQQPHLCYRLAISGKADAALLWMERLVAAYPENHEVNGCAALVALEAKRIDQAAHFADRACALSPSDARWNHAKARVRRLQFDSPT